MDKIELLRQMAASDPDNAQASFLLGLELAEQGHATEALQAYTNALRTCTDDLKVQIVAELGRLSLGASTADESRHGRGDDSDGDSSSPGTSDRPRGERKLTAKLGAGEDGDGGADEYDGEETYEELENRGPGTNQGSGIGLRVLPGGVATPRPAAAPNRVTFADVGGLADVKQSIDMKIIKPFTTPGLFSKFKKKTGGGILLYGPPGCGKTYIAKATAGECNAAFVSVHISDILGKYIGESEENLHDMFTTARANRPCVLFFDEIDTLGYSRAKSVSQPMRGVIDQLLMEMDGLNMDTDRLLIIGATNTPWDVDAAFKRPGRFDKAIFVAPPDLAARTTIFQLKLRDKPAVDIDYAVLAEATDLYSGADIENVVEVATEQVISEILTTGIERPITMRDLQSAIADTKPSTINWLRTVKNYIKYANQDGQYNEVDAFLRQHRNV